MTAMKSPVVGEKRVCKFAGLVKGVDATAKTIDAIVSTVHGDRDREIILPSAFAKRLEHYKRNPVFIWCHDQKDPKNYLGSADPNRIAIIKTGIGMLFDCSKVLQIPEADRARLVFGLFEAGAICSFSVGFMPYAWISPRELDKYPAIKAELDGVDLTDVEVIYTDVELWEVSACGVPSNRQSVVVGRTPGELAHTIVQGTPEQVESALAMIFDAVRQRSTSLPADTGGTKQEEEEPMPAPADSVGKTVEHVRVPDHPGKTKSAVVNDCCSRLDACAYSIASVDVCHCSGCNRWDGCRCDGQCCCCQSGIPCRQCKCCKQDQHILHECCAILDAIHECCQEMAGEAEGEAPAGVVTATSKPAADDGEPDDGKVTLTLTP